MGAALFKIPDRWRAPALPDRTALYPALYLGAEIRREASLDTWRAAPARVLVADGRLTDDERAVIEAARGRLVLVGQGGLGAEDRAFAEDQGCLIAAFADAGPLATPPGADVRAVTGLAARAAEDGRLRRALPGLGPTPARAPFPAAPGGLAVLVAQSAAAAREVLPAVRDGRFAPGGPVVVAAPEEALEEIAGMAGVIALSQADPRLLGLIQEAPVVLCALGEAVPDDPRPGQWVRTALFHGAPAVAASHPSIDALADLCVVDDWERGLGLYTRAALARLKASALARARLAGPVEPARVAAEWRALLTEAAKGGRRAGRRHRTPPQLLTLIDIHQDLDVLLPILLALKARGSARLRIVVSDWLVEDSPRVLRDLSVHGLDAEVRPREAVRRGDAPEIGGACAVLAAADATVRAHKAGHALLTRARAKGLPTFTVQHGFENIGLTYADDLHGTDVRFAAETVFTWCAPEALAEWVTAETRAAVTPVGSPKAAPPPGRAPKLDGDWALVVGVFENLHWARFDEDYRARLTADLARAAAARPEALFLVKPHHAGRWMSKNRGLLPDLPNLYVIDPLDPTFEPYTAPALLSAMDVAITTPSTVAVDAARAGRPVAVIANGLDLPLYAPLPILRAPEDWDGFLGDRGLDWMTDNEAFLARALLPGRADHRIAARIEAALVAKAANRWKPRKVSAPA